MKFDALLKKIAGNPAAFKGITADSREVKDGYLFVAMRGESYDGHAFLPECSRAGVIFAVGEVDPPSGLGIPYCQVENSKIALALLADAFYKHPSRSMKVVGITGTSGKTTTSYLVESVLDAAGFRVGVIGTVNFRFGGKILPSTHTTPGPVELQKLMAQMRDEGCTAVVMEVSSHALKQKRVAGVAFDVMVFTNLTAEHLDYHLDMDDYFKSKLLLFTDSATHSCGSGKNPSAVINGDAEYGKRLMRELGVPHSELSVIAYGWSDALRADLTGVHGEFEGIRIDSPLIGRFNAENILAAAGVGRALRIDAGQVAAGIARLHFVPGRLQGIPNARGIHVLVDYAHKSDALEKVLLALREMRQGKRLITVFGCGGDRDRKKRPVMGRLAAELSDLAFVTSDNPRTEDPQAIVDEILSGMTAYSNFRVQLDRKKAIQNAIAEAKTGDLVLIAGKGHEDYQIIADPASPGKTQKIHFDDREVAEEVLTSDFKNL